MEFNYDASGQWECHYTIEAKDRDEAMNIADKKLENIEGISIEVVDKEIY